MADLFTREPETLDGYLPKFSLNEVMFNYRTEQIQIVGHFKDFDFDPENIEYETRHIITVAGVELSRSSRYGDGRAIDIVVSIINEFLADPKNEQSKPEAMAYLRENAEELNRSKRYWLADAHVKRINGQKNEIARLQDEVRRAEWIASMNAVEVKSGRALTKDEKTLLLAEFSGGEYEEIS
jgi:hypothetical protein